MNKRVADVLVETLQAAGVKTCYGIVGNTLNRIAHAIDRSEIDWVHMRHEEAEASVAGVEALLTGHERMDLPGTRARSQRSVPRLCRQAVRQRQRRAGAAHVSLFDHVS